MLDPDSAALLARVLTETRSGRLKWQQDADDYFRAEVGTNAQPVLIRRMFIVSGTAPKAEQWHVFGYLNGPNMNP